MRFAIDAAELEGRPTGVGRYLANLLRAWLAGDGDETFILYHRHDIAVDLGDSPRLVFRRLPPGRISAGWYRQQGTLAAALRADAPDALFAPAYTMPLRWRGPTLLTVHDLSYEAHPEWFSPLHGLRMRWLTRRSCARAEKILAVSSFTRDEVIKRYGISPEKVAVVHHGIDDTLLRAPFTPEDELRRRLNLPGPFVLMVGSIFERRFPLEVIGAFRRLGDLGLSLVIAGEDRRRAGTNLDSEIENRGLAGRVRWVRYCPEADLAGLYRCASACIYLSEYEGFGLPPLEAMLFEVPVVVSGRGALREIYEGSAALVDHESDETIAAAIRRLFNDAAWRGNLVRAGAARVRSLGLDRCAAETLALLRAVRGGS